MSAALAEVLVPGMVAEALATLDRVALARWISEQRWFGAKGREASAARVVDHVVLEQHFPALVLAVVCVDFHGGGEPERFAVPMRVTPGASESGPLGASRVGATVARVDDASADPGVALALVALGRSGNALACGGGASLRGVPVPGAAGSAGGEAARDVQPLGLEQSNTSYRVGEHTIVKLFRRLAAGVQPEVEALEYLGANGFAYAPRMRSWVQYEGGAGVEPAVVALAQDWIPNRGDAWTDTLAVLDAVRAGARDGRAASESMEHLGHLVGRLHATLALGAAGTPFAPRALDAPERAALTGAMQRRVAEAVTLLAPRLGALPGMARAAGEGLIAQSEQLDRALAQGLRDLGDGCWQIRVHGDLHLGQVLITPGGEFAVIDFEGEPARPMAARREPAPALRDVAGMMRSFSYAAEIAARPAREQGDEAATERVDRWESAARERFLAGYLAGSAAAPVALLPRTPDALRRALALFEIEKALYEVVYELNHRPAWVPVPLAGINRALSALLR